MARLEFLTGTLAKCPCCDAFRLDDRLQLPSDGIPDGMKLEWAYECGAKVFLTDAEGLEVSQPCSQPLDRALGDLEDEADEADENDFDA